VCLLNQKALKVTAIDANEEEGTVSQNSTVIFGGDFYLD
jgi:hypothetical protein